MAAEQGLSAFLLKSLSSESSGHAPRQAVPVKCHRMSQEMKTVISYKKFKICRVIKIYCSMLKNISVLLKEQPLNCGALHKVNQLQ